MIVVIFVIFILNFSLNFCDHFFFIFDKERMIVKILIFGSLFREAIHIQLSNKGMHIFMFEIDGQYNIGKIVLIYYHKTIAIVIPMDDIFVLLVLNQGYLYLEDLIGFKKKSWWFFCWKKRHSFKNNIKNIRGYWVIKDNLFRD